MCSEHIQHRFCLLFHFLCYCLGFGVSFSPVFASDGLQNVLDLPVMPLRSGAKEEKERSRINGAHLGQAGELVRASF